MEKEKPILEWKKLYIRELITNLAPHGHVLEVGFADGSGSELIQSNKPSHHTILVKNSEEAKVAKKWAQERENITVIEGNWEKELDKLGTFDSIFFHDYPLHYEIEKFKRLSPEEASQALENANEMISFLEKEFSSVSVNFSDDEIDEFFNNVGKKHPEDIPLFFQNLHKYGYITKEQFENCKKKFGLEEDTSNNKPKSPAKDIVIQFLEKCLEKHTKEGSKIVCYFIDPISKFEDADFFEAIITNPYADYSEEIINIEVPECSFNLAIVNRVEKLG